MKDFFSKKKNLTNIETITLTEGCSAILTNKLPLKLKDPGSFIIPCSINNHYFGKALCDLGASINLLPLSAFIKLRIGHMKPTAMTLQLANRSLAQSEGQIKDVLFHVDKFTFSANFIILDCEADKEVLIILGQLFLAIGRTLIDVYNGELTMRLNDEQVTFSVFESVHHKDKAESHIVDVLDDLIEEELENQSTVIAEEIAVTSEAASLDNCGSVVEASKVEIKHRWQIESLDLTNRTTLIFKPSIEKTPTLELKPLPPHLKYIFLGNHNTLPVIISATLDETQEKKLTHIIKQHK
ncbi:uncharacterized protein LOC105772039 [Gossypium raimondii]|uniref:uncharacterized protein LOC105772039 n=1 Tax=Gossypium raimondii TaxID=29730 RepID=UPI00063AC40E|nr:uncharacterized protein LOC105772039 [Gossypium raimondii]